MGLSSEARARQRRDAVPAGAACAAGAATCHGAATCEPLPVPPLASNYAQFALQADGKGHEHHHGLRAHARRPAQRRQPGPHRAHRRRRGAYVRHGPTCSSRSASTATSASATHPRTSAPSSRTARPRTADSGRGHQRGGRHRQLDGCGHQLQRARGLAMLPFYIYYSMFGFSAWATPSGPRPTSAHAAFWLGATSGRTTLGGEGLQHQDGSRPPHRRHHPQLQGLRPGLLPARWR